MSLYQKPDKVKYFIAMLSNPHHNTEDVGKAVTGLQNAFGEIDYKSKWFPFEITNYYENEMGKGLKRMFLSFESLYSPEKLSEAKITTNDIERRGGLDVNRKVNLDCGYMDYYKVVLASVKYGGQKVYLTKGIYADIVLYYRKGLFEPFFWTFPDFKDNRYNQVLLDIRNIYKQQMKSIE